MAWRPGDPLRRVVIKVGTAVVTQEDGHAALGRVGDVVEAVCAMRLLGIEVVVVTSGAIGIGAQVLKRQAVMSMSLEQVTSATGTGGTGGFAPRACAAAGQSGLQSLYETLFAQYDTACSQILVTDADLEDEARRVNLQATLSQLLALGIVPILNENDVITTRETPLMDGDKIWWDNESLAAVLAAQVGADLLVLMSDTDGLYDTQGRHVDTLPAGALALGEAPGSRIGVHGAEVMADALRAAVKNGVGAAAVVSGCEPGAVQRLVSGDAPRATFAFRSRL